MALQTLPNLDELDPLLRGAAPASVNALPQFPQAAATLPQRLPNIFAPKPSAPEPLPSLGGLPPISAVSYPGAQMGGLQPLITNPRQQQEQALQQKISQFENPAPKTGGFWRNLGRGLERTGEVAGSVLFPEVVGSIPGTMLYNRGEHAQRVNELAGLQKQDVSEQDEASRRMLEGAQAAQIPETAQREKEQLSMQLSGHGLKLDEGGNVVPQTEEEYTPEFKADLAAKQNPWARLPGNEPVGNADALNKGMQDRYQVLHPGVTLPPEFTLPANATKNDFDRIDKLMTAAETATGTKEQRDSANQLRMAMFALAQGKVEKGDSARADASYKFNQGELDKLGTPLQQLGMRIGRLQDTMNQNSPAGDALTAPELLTVMAGGQGSGLRMNEAEIARIVGGRSVLESLKARLNQVALDPKQARSITPEQHREMAALVQAVNNKLQAKITAINDAGGKLIDSDDPKEHRRIVQAARQSLEEVDAHGFYISQKIPGKGTVTGFTADGKVQVDDAR